MLPKWFQLDVKNAFLNGFLSEEVYSAILRVSLAPGLVCHLCRALYGIKQSPRVWYARFHDVVLQIGFQPSTHNFALFISQTSHGFVLLLLYVDDMIITGSDSVAIAEVKCHLFDVLK